MLARGRPRAPIWKMRVLLFLLPAVAACGSPPPTSILDTPPLADPELHRTVAFVNGEPIPWIEVARRMMEVNPREAVDKYVHWRVVHDAVEKHSIQHTDEELLRRSRVAFRRYRDMLGREKLEKDLKRKGRSKEELIREWARYPNLAETLTLEKLIVFGFLSRGAVDVDALLFTEEEDGKVFDEYLAVLKDFDKAHEKLTGTRMRGRIQRHRTGFFSRDLRPPDVDKSLVDRIFTLGPGETTSRVRVSGTYAMYRVVDRIEKRPGSYTELADDVLEAILADPPSTQLLQRWMDARFRAASIEYEPRVTGNR